MPGNAGTALMSKNLDINIDDFQEVKDAIKNNKIDLLIVGPEKPLVNGIVDFLNDTGVKIFGPNKAASQLEGSKIFTKKLCEKYKCIEFIEWSPTDEEGNILHNQAEAGNHCLKLMKMLQVDWCANIDMDEYIVSELRKI